MIDDAPFNWIPAGVRINSKVETTPCACNSGVPKMFPQALDSILDNPFNVAHDILSWATPALMFRITPGQEANVYDTPYQRYTPPTPFTPVDGILKRYVPPIPTIGADASYIDGGELPVVGGNLAIPPANLGSIIGEQIGGADEHGCSPSLPDGPVWCGTLHRCIPRSKTCPTDIMVVDPGLPETPPSPPTTGGFDEHGCVPTAGYQWCVTKGRCIRPYPNFSDGERCEQEMIIPRPVGGDVDEHGCNPATGYSWCDSLAKCVRKWETPCPTGVLADPCNVTPGYSWCAPLGRCANSCPTVDGGVDSHGCIAGQEWCVIKNKCIRPFPAFSDGETCPTEVLTLPPSRERPPDWMAWLNRLVGGDNTTVSYRSQALGDATITPNPGGVSVGVPVYRPVPRNMQVLPQGAMEAIPRYVPGGVSSGVPFVQKTNNMYIGVV